MSDDIYLFIYNKALFFHDIITTDDIKALGLQLLVRHNTIAEIGGKTHTF